MDNVKRAQVIMLPTENNGTIDTYDSGKICLTKEKTDWSWRRGFNELYIISDDEIKEGDWVLSKLNEIVLLKKNYTNFNYKKIIATTDTSLTEDIYKNIDGIDRFVEYGLPQPSQQFIEKYIEAYNKDEVITDVLVEYLNELKDFQNTFKCDTNPHNLENNKLKINPKDNTITIKKLKDSWNKEEVIKMILKVDSWEGNYNFQNNIVEINSFINDFK